MEIELTMEEQKFFPNQNGRMENSLKNKNSVTSQKERPILEKWRIFYEEKEP